MKQVMKCNWILWKKYYEIDSAYVMIKLLSSIFQVVQPLSSIWLFKLFLDGIFIRKSLSYCIYIILILVIINVLSQIVFTLLNNRITPVSNQKVTAVLSKEIMDKYLKVSLYDLNKPEFYNKYTQVLRDFPVRVISMQDTISSFLGNILSIITVVTLMVTINPVMIIISLVSIVANLLITPILNKIGYQIYLEKTTDSRIQDYVKRVFYIYEYVKELKSHSVSRLMIKKYNDANDSLIWIIKKYSYKNVFYTLLIGIVNIVSFFFILLYLALQALKGVLSIGDVSALYNATEQLKSDALSFFSIIPNFMENRMYVENYMAFMAVGTEEGEKKKIPLKEEIESITFDNVSFSYTNEADNQALKNIQLTIRKNEKIALVGPNGAGKSTFVDLLTGLYTPFSGNIYVNGTDYKKYSSSDIRDKFMVIFQNAQIYAATIAENILQRELCDEKDERIVNQVLEKVGLYSRVKKLPNGIHTTLTKEFSEEGIMFSGGEKQKLIVARALASRAKVIVLDEVTSNMDAISEHEIFDQIMKFAEDKMVVYISHKLSTTKIADKIYLLEKGEITEAGTHKELMEREGKYREMFLLQAKKYGDVT